MSRVFKNVRRCDGVKAVNLLVMASIGSSGSLLKPAAVLVLVLQSKRTCWLSQDVSALRLDSPFTEAELVSITCNFHHSFHG